MRPRRHLLLFCEDEHRASDLLFALQTRLYRVSLCADTAAAAALALSAEPPIDCVLVLRTPSLNPQQTDALLAQLDRNPVVAARVVEIAPVGNTAASALHRRVPAGERIALFETIRLVCARKRGPKPIRDRSAA